MLINRVHTWFRLSIFLTLVFCSAGSAQSGSQYFFEQGNLAYRNQEYKAALEFYQRIEQAGFSGSQLFYNIGNCYYKLGEVGESILYYEKAQRLAPDDEEIRTNLDIANLKVRDRIEMPPRLFIFEWWDRVRFAMTVDELSWMLLICYILTMVIAASWLFFRDSGYRKLLQGGLIGFGLVTLIFAYILFDNIREGKINRQGILLVPSATVFSGPDENSTDVFLLHEGTKVKLSEQRGEWIRIALPDEKTGWLREEMLGEI